MIQVVKCKCNSIIAACIEPDCYTDVEWQRNLRKYVKDGYMVEMKEKGKWCLEMCKCNNSTKQPELFI